MFFLLFILVSVVNSAQFSAKPEESMTTAKIIAHWGYTVEKHDVITEDGYNLSMLRIPHGRRSYKDNSTCHRPPFLLIHGMMQDASAYVLNPPESSPVAIDKALALNGAKSLYLVSHSRGTFVSNMMLSERTEYNNKVRAVFEMAGPGTGKGVRGYIGFLAPFLPSIMPLLNMYKTMLGPHEIGFHHGWLLGKVTRMFCGGSFQMLCNFAMSLSIGLPAKTFNASRMPVYYSHIGISVSSWDFLQLGQHVFRDAIFHFDVSPSENMRRYGQTIALAYNYTNIDTELYLFWSRNDVLLPKAGPEEWFRAHTKPGVLKGIYEVPEYNHMDFVMATDLADRIFNKIIAIARGKEEYACLV